MHKETIRVILLSLVLWACESPAENNIALNRKCEFSVKPNYSYCTDEQDYLQLTDGKTKACRWTKKGTVGWARASTGIEIVIDLSEIKDVDTVKIHSVGGGRSNVEFPEFIALLASEDGETYRFESLIGSEQLPAGGNQRIPHIFVINKLNIKARFIKIVVRPTEPFFFADEIEIISENEAKSLDTKDRVPLHFTQNPGLLRAIEDYLQLRVNVRETLNTFQNYRHKFSTRFYEKIMPDLEVLVKKCKLPTDRVFSEEQLSLYGDKLWVIRAQIYKHFYEKSIVGYVTNPMEVVLQKQMPLVNLDANSQMNIQLWQREYESAAVNIINCSQKTMEVIVSISPLTKGDGKTIDSNKTFTIRRAIYVKALNLGKIADPLVLQGEHPFKLHPGQLAQIWLTVFNPELTAGDYKASLAVADATTGIIHSIITIPVKLSVEKPEFPYNVDLNTCNWAYPKCLSGTKDHLYEAALDLKKHYINTLVIPPSNLPLPEKTQSIGEAISRLNFSELDKYLNINEHTRTYLFYLAFNNPVHRRYFGEWLTPAWENNFSDWLTVFVHHLKQIGIGYDEFAIYPFDEELGDDFYQIAKLIKEVDSNVNIYANHLPRDPSQITRFSKLVDIWVPNKRHFKLRHASLQMIKNLDKRVWMYAGKSVSKTAHPYSFYRLMPWRAFEQGFTGAGFWFYLDFRTYSWHDTLRPNGYYGVVYPDECSFVDTYGENIIPSRRWESWREGIEDYQYLYEVKKAIERVQKSNPVEANQAQRGLKEQVQNVLRDKRDCEKAYNAREKLNEILLTLKGLPEFKN